MTTRNRALMKAALRNLYILPALIAALGLVLAGRVEAQTFTTLYSFTPKLGPPYTTNSDGASPQAGLVLSVLLELPGGFSLDGLRGPERRQRSF
jgi:hypothetical protein